MNVSLHFHPSQSPAAIRARLLAGLQRGSLPPRFLYDSFAQGQRWLEYHHACAPSGGQGELLQLYERAAAALSEDFGRFVSLGCGGGQKDKALLTQKRGLHYSPVDTSPSLVLTSVEQAQEVAATIHPVVADLSAKPGRESFGEDEAPWLFGAFGLIPNFAPEVLLPYLRSLMRPSDRTLISFNLSPGPHDQARARILPQYDHPLAHAWFHGALVELGVKDAELTVRTEVTREGGEAWRLRCDAHLPKQTIMLFGQRIELLELLVFFSNRFTRQEAQRTLHAHGLAVEQCFAIEEEAIFLVGPGNDNSQE